MEVASDLRLMESIVKLLCQWLYIVNGGCFGAETDQMDCESVVPLLVHSELRLLQTGD